jgi:asparagine synthase (glutamine-hydrolysing)
MDLSRYAKQFVRHADSEWYDQYRGYIGLSGGDLLGNGSAARDGYDRVADGISCDDPLLRLFALDSETQLSEMLLLLSDKMTMATSIECRVPFLDRQLVETAAQIPAGYKVKGGRLKNLLRQAVADILPPEVIDRRKRGFGAPMGSWLKGELKPMRDALLRRDVVEHRGLFPYERINGMVHRHDSGKEDHTDLLMVLINLELWFRVFVDKTSASDVTTQLHECTKAA